MGLSIITPHYNDLKGIRNIYGCLQRQVSKNWEWIIVDDCSRNSLVIAIKKWHRELDDLRVKIYFQKHRNNASFCRNFGAKNANFELLVFLDADDYVNKSFVKNRQIDVNEFTVFKNMGIDDKKLGVKHVNPQTENYLDSFLSANFVWQTSCILWDCEFFNHIGGFDPRLKRLQDVELSIRALLLGSNYNVLDNEVDFYHCTKPIRLKPDIVQNSCQSVNYLVSKLKREFSLKHEQYAQLKSYYFACTKGLHRTKNRKDIPYLIESLKHLYLNKVITTFEFGMGRLLLFLYGKKLTSDSFFIKANRYYFK